ncbi:MAG TPA: serine hydrolase domain-containing protein [Pyrinomonadaceae bacterium]
MNRAKPDEHISAFLTERIAAHDFPSAVYAVAERGQPVLADALGHAVLEPQKRRATIETIYDLASLTKPLITGLLCARRIEQGELELDERVARYLPEFKRADKASITVRELLTHTSGLPAWRPLYILAGGKSEETLGVIVDQPLEATPGQKVIYSDLGFITLGFLLERLKGSRLAQLAREEIFDPLGLKRTFFNPDKAMQTGVAACETGNAFERETCGTEQSALYADWREQLIWGEVHDGNAHFLGGAAGHAGLFSDAGETLRLARQFLAGYTELLRPETCALFRTNMTEGLEEARSVGWQLAATRDSTAGQSLPPDSFGHLGFTGTSCWSDPLHERIFILLTNRTHAHPPPFVNINSVRRRFHMLAVEALDQRRGQAGS